MIFSIWYHFWHVAPLLHQGKEVVVAQILVLLHPRVEVVVLLLYLEEELVGVWILLLLHPKEEVVVGVQILSEMAKVAVELIMQRELGAVTGLLMMQSFVVEKLVEELVQIYCMELE